MGKLRLECGGGVGGGGGKESCAHVDLRCAKSQPPCDYEMHRLWPQIATERCTLHLLLPLLVIRGGMHECLIETDKVGQTFDKSRISVCEILNQMSMVKFFIYLLHNVADLGLIE